jgi:type I restriction enzyme S subunit
VVGKDQQLRQEGADTKLDLERPEGWAFAKISDILTVNYGKGLKKSNRKTGIVPVYGSNGVVGRHNSALTGGPTIILGRKGTVGAVNFSTVPCWPIDTTYFIDKFHGLVPEFIFHAMGSLNLGDLDTSTAIPGLNRNDIYKQQIPLPPIPEQKRIVAKVEELLARFNAARERLAKVKEILKRFRQAVLAAACSGRLTEDWSAEKTREEGAANNTVVRIQNELSAGKENNVSIPDLPENWKWTALREICEYQGGFAFKSKEFSNENENQVLRIGNVRPGYIDFDIAPVYIDDEYAAAKRGFQVMENDILVSMTGTKYKRDYGYAGIVPKTYKKVFLNQRVGRLRTRTTIQPKFLLYWLQTKTFRDFFFENETGNVNQGNVGAEALRKNPAPVPPMTEQMGIVRRVEILFKLADAIEKRVAAAGERAERLTQAILAKAFRGELVPTEAELARQEGRSYEQASILLAKIKTKIN